MRTRIRNVAIAGLLCSAALPMVSLPAALAAPSPATPSPAAPAPASVAPAAPAPAAPRWLTSTPPPSPADPNAPLADQRLRESVAAALSQRPLGTNSVPMVPVEVLTHFGPAVEAAARALGGVVTGDVPGQVVQVQMPATKVAALAVADGVSVIQAPRRISRPPLTPVMRPQAGPGFGSTVGSNVAITGADTWQAAGITGAVKVGIVDYFDRGLWDPTEEGPNPDAAHSFCLDSSVPAGSTANLCSPTNNDGINNGDGFEHGVAVSQVIKDMAPGAELYLASVGTTSDLQAAIDWFAANGVHIVTRSLGATLDGPGDGTGPLAAVVDAAASHNITWFNSAGNEGIDQYARITVPTNLASTGGYVDFDNGPGVDTYLRISSHDVLFDGIRWSDWNLPPAQRTDYAVEVWVPTSDPDSPVRKGENFNPTDLTLLETFDDNQRAGADPIEAAGQFYTTPNTFGFAGGISYIRIHRKAGTSLVGPPDTMEIAVGFGVMELGRSQAPYSAAKPVVDSRNPALVAVGAIDPASGSGSPSPIAVYSSQGPTNDGRIKPDVTAPSCFASSIYAPGCFNGTSAASPTAAGMAALLLDAGVALPGVPLAAAVRHFVVDRNALSGSTATPDGPDNVYGTGEVKLPNPPTPAGAATPSAYQALTPIRLLDTRITGPTLSTNGILDVPVLGVAGIAGNASAVAVNITSANAATAGFVQAIPFLRNAYGSSSTLNIAGVGSIKPNFAIVPVGVDGKISIFDQPGGDLIVDVLGYFAPTTATVAAGRLVPIDPVRTLDTRTANLVPAGWTAHEPNNETVQVPSAAGVPASGVSALVLNVTSTASGLPGYLRAEPTGATPLASTVNYVPGVDSANSVIVPVGPDGTVSVYTSTLSHIVVDVTGYITDATAPVSAAGRFVPIQTARAYDSRSVGSPWTINETRDVQLTGLAAPLPVVPNGASAISINLTAADELGPGFLTAAAAGAPLPPTSSLNYLALQPIANAGLIKLSPGGSLGIFSNFNTDVIIDVNGYFT